jgi:hypothetical protein
MVNTRLFFPMRHPQYQNQQSVIVDFVYHAIVADSDAPEVVVRRQFDGVWGAGSPRNSSMVSAMRRRAGRGILSRHFSAAGLMTISQRIARGVFDGSPLSCLSLATGRERGRGWSD